MHDFLRHAPHIAYAEIQKESVGATKLVQPINTRWGSQIDLAESLVRNRMVVEKALLKLRGDKFEFRGNELMFVWNITWWSTVESFCNWLLPLRRYAFLSLYISSFTFSYCP